MGRNRPGQARIINWAPARARLYPAARTILRDILHIPISEEANLNLSHANISLIWIRESLGIGYSMRKNYLITSVRDVPLRSDSNP